jgi:hypothetical protein
MFATMRIRHASFTAAPEGERPGGRVPRYVVTDGPVVTFASRRHVVDAAAILAVSDPGSQLMPIKTGICDPRNATKRSVCAASF